MTDVSELPEEPESGDDHFLPHYFPTFGVSKRTQIWIYGAIAIIVIFCAGLGIWFLLVRRRRRKNQRDDYEFEMLEEEEHLTGATGGRRPKRRAGELYDAFAGESDEEQLLSEGEEDYEDEEEEKGGYRDAAADREGARTDGNGTEKISEK